MTRLLRLSVLLNRGRMPIELPPINLSVNEAQDMTLDIPEDWLNNHPLTAADLEQEVELSEAVGYELHIVKS